MIFNVHYVGYRTPSM